MSERMLQSAISSDAGAEAPMRSRLARFSQSGVVVIAAVTVVALWVLFVVVIETMRDHYLREALDESKNIARAFEEGITRDMRYIDSVLRIARNEHETRGYNAVIRFLRNEPVDTALIDHIGVDDAQGNLRFLTSGPVRGPVNVADRDYFRAQRENPDTGLFVGVPAKGRGTGRWLVRVSQALKSPDGQFAGIVKAAIDPYHLARLYDSFSMGPNGTVMLVGLDRVLRSERGLKTEMLGRDMSAELPWPKIDEARTGAYRVVATSGKQSDTHHYVYRRLAGVPLVVIVGIAERDVVSRLLRPNLYLFGLVILGTCGVIGFAALLLRQIRSQAQLAAVNAELIEAYRAKSEFLSKMSHELRTPLNAIIGFSEMIKTQIFGPVGGRRYLDYADAIHSSGEHLLDLINDILEMSKIEANKLVLDERLFGVRDAVEWSVNLLQEQARRRGVTMDVTLSPAIQALSADERAVRQVLLNILGNALKFSRDGGRIDIRGFIDRNGDLVLMVADTGVGMPRDVLESALVPFGRGTNLKTSREQGTGLGLPISKALMARHGGDLVLASEPGKGTVVTLRFPASRVRAFDLEAPQAAAAAAD